MTSDRAISTSTPLPKKLGVKEGSCLALVGAPPGLERTLGRLPDGVDLRERVRGPLDVIVFFTTSGTELRRRFEKLAGALAPTGGLWVAWPKKSSGVGTDLDQASVMEIGLESGRLVDNKVCAIDDTWSGLRFVIRKENRPRVY
jgi:hypothetical protein